MNKKIFTLLVGAIMLIGSVFTVNAQLPLSPYTPEKGTRPNETLFRDMLTASDVDRLPAYNNISDYYYLLTVTGVANPSQSVSAATTSAGISLLSLIADSTLVLSVDSFAFESRFLRLEQLGKLDYQYRYNYNTSHKFGALRNALWCLDYDPGIVDGSNMVYNFTQMSTGLPLRAPYIENGRSFWKQSGDLRKNWIYTNGSMGIDTYDEDLIVDGWHFSQTYKETQDLQKNMPLYSYYRRDSVVVLVLEEVPVYDDPESATTFISGATKATGEDAITGGWKVTVKNVSVNDLIRDATGNVYTASPTAITGKTVVENVLLFTLQKVNPFVMNADDWNAISTAKGFSFNPNANTVVTNQDKRNTYTNPFIDATFANLRAVEVNDSLYHYGYMQFRSGATTSSAATFNKWLYVDTAFANYGNNQFLAFAWSDRRDNSYPTFNTMTWGQTFAKASGYSFATSMSGGILDRWIYLNGGVEVDNPPTLPPATPPATVDVFWRMDSIVWAIFDTILVQANAQYPGNSFTYADLFYQGEINNQTHHNGGGDIIFTLDQEICDKYTEIATEALANGFPATIPSIGGPWTWTWSANAFTDTDPHGGLGVNNGLFDGSAGQGFIEGEDYLMRTNAPNYRKDYARNWAIYSSYSIDSVNVIWTYLKDSIMENQSKFRVVYDPSADSTFINVYQSRVRYPDFENGAGNAQWPAWWKNSFDTMTISGGGLASPRSDFFRPQDLWTQQFYDGTLGATLWPAWNAALAGPLDISKAANYYYLLVREQVGSISDAIADWDPTVPGSGMLFEGHGKGDPATGLRQHGLVGGDPTIFNLHSFMEFWPKSTTNGIDRVLISTADTIPIYLEFYQFQVSGGSPIGINWGMLGHMYSWSTNSAGWNMYKDSLLYVDLQDLGGNSIITLDQTYLNGQKKLDTQIKIAYGDKCKEYESQYGPRATIDDDLYLIRNSLGQYLSVPLWSTCDSIYWITPEHYEDLTKMPSYQWAIENLRQIEGSPFEITNREFEKVNIPYAYVYKNHPGPFIITGKFANSRFNNRIVYGKATTKEQALVIGSITPAKFVDLLEQRFALDEYSFIRLGKTVKENQLLGYKYIDKDNTYIDVYAFKFNHFSTQNEPVYLSWNGYKNPKDSVLYAQAQRYEDKLYFNLQEMTKEEIGAAAAAGNDWQGWVELKGNSAFTTLYNSLANMNRNYTNAESIIMERFGYMTNKIADLKPLARQAYRLFLQDYYRWHPTEKGHYVTVGEHDFYVLSDKANASRSYVKGSGSVAGLFGIPHFYFRETFFEYDAPDPAKVDPRTGKQERDYFAIIQRLDTARINRLDGIDKNVYFEWGFPTWDDIHDYLTLKLGSTVAARLQTMIKVNREHQLALLDIDPAFTRAKFVIRGDANVISNISAFQLERDDDPIYRRFHVNEPNERFGDQLWNTDIPDTLEFHLLNSNEYRGYALYENSGNYIDTDQSDQFGRDGGRVFNRTNNGFGEYFKDTIGNVLSFLGINNVNQYQQTNRSFFLDTAYINRGTGWIKPQYLIVVDPYNPFETGDCDPITGTYPDPNPKYVIGRYMYNTAMYAKAVKDSVLQTLPSREYWKTDHLYAASILGTSITIPAYTFRSDNFSKVQPIKEPVFRKQNGESYTLHTESSPSKWERFAFSWAIHKGDSLYVLKGIEPAYDPNNPTSTSRDQNDPQRVWRQLLKEYGVEGTSQMIDFKRLVNENIDKATSPYIELYWPLGDRTAGVGVPKLYNNFLKMEDVLAMGHTIGLHAIIDLSDNTHKDWVFSFRYVERGSSDFVIESEVGDRDIRNAAIIRPGYGGWLKIENDVPVITRSDEKDNMGQAGGAVMNVHRGDRKKFSEPTGTEAISTDIQVIGGTGSVAILNAAGKKVVISNILGQTIANTSLSTDNATIVAPAGVAVVAVEGESAVKVVVK